MDSPPPLPPLSVEGQFILSQIQIVLVINLAASCLAVLFYTMFMYSNLFLLSCYRILRLCSSPPDASPSLKAVLTLRPLRALPTCSLGPRLWGIVAVAVGLSSLSLPPSPACPRRDWVVPGWGGTCFPLAPFRGVPSLLLRGPVV